MGSMTPRKMATILSTPEVRRAIDATLIKWLDEVRPLLRTQAESLAGKTGVSEELAETVIAGALVEAALDQRTWSAALARSAGYTLSTIATAAGLQPTSTPKNWPGFNEMVEADQWARQHPGQRAPQVEGLRLGMIPDTYPVPTDPSVAPERG